DKSTGVWSHDVTRTTVCRPRHLPHNDVDRVGDSLPCAPAETAMARVARAIGRRGSESGPPADATLGAGRLVRALARHDPVVAFATPEIRPRLENRDGRLAPC